MIYSDTMNSERLIEFFEQLIKNSARKIYLILDNLRVHHSKIIKEWLDKEENKTQLEVFFLPPYSPDRNPDEYLNCDLKQGMSAKPPPKSQINLCDNVKKHMIMLQQRPDRIVKYFRIKSGFHRYICSNDFSL